MISFPEEGVLLTPVQRGQSRQLRGENVPGIIIAIVASAACRGMPVTQKTGGKRGRGACESMCKHVTDERGVFPAIHQGVSLWENKTPLNNKHNGDPVSRILPRGFGDVQPALPEGPHLLNKCFLRNCFASQARQTLCLLAAGRQDVIWAGGGESDLRDRESVMNQRRLLCHGLEMTPPPPASPFSCILHMTE